LSAHVTQEELRAAESLPLKRRLEFVTHLLGGCPECNALTAGWYRWAWSAEPEPRVDGAVYEDAIDHAFAKFREEAKALAESETPWERANIRYLWESMALAALAHLEGIPLCNALLDWSWDLRHDNPKGMIFLAELATKTVAGLYPVTPEAVDARARAWGELANAYRVRDDFLEAERAFDKAFKLLEKGTGDPALKARLFDLHASFYGTRRQFMLAFSTLDVVHTLHLQMRDEHLAGRALITKALYAFYAGKTDWALAINREGISMIDGRRDPGLVSNALHTQILYLSHDDHCLEARRFLFQNRLQAMRGGRINELKVRWLEGRISYGLGDFPAAEIAFQEVKEGFEVGEQGLHTALCLLDLSLVWLRQGKAKEAEEAVAQAKEVFFSLQVPEVYSTVVVLKEALRLGKATVELVEDIVAWIRRWQINPDTALE
jgi:tetratricopeptide (TPR) repeat protein